MSANAAVVVVVNYGGPPANLEQQDRAGRGMCQVNPVIAGHLNLQREQRLSRMRGSLAW
jgi:hypothetical protein